MPPDNSPPHGCARAPTDGSEPRCATHGQCQARRNPRELFVGYGSLGTHRDFSAIAYVARARRTARNRCARAPRREGIFPYRGNP